MRNPVKHHMHKSVRAFVIAHKKTLLKSEAILRDAREVLSESQFDSGTMDIDDDGNGCCTGYLDCVGCSSIEIDCEEE